MAVWGPWWLVQGWEGEDGPGDGGGECLFDILDGPVVATVVVTSQGREERVLAAGVKSPRNPSWVL